MSNQLMIFEGINVEVFELNGVVYFNPYHVGKCLDLTESAVRNHLAKMNKKQAKLIKNSDILSKDFRNSNVHLKDFRKLHNTGEKFLTESGVYKLAFKSEKPEAEKFTDWVTDEVLPIIRKEGAYITDKADPEMLRSKANEIETVNVLNETAKIILPTLDEAGIKPQYKALTLKMIYEKAGLKLPIEGLKADRKIFDLMTIAEILGIYSNSNKPHGQAVSAIVAKLDISDDEKELVSFERNGHMGTTTQYKEGVISKIKKWLEDNGYPIEIRFIDSKGNEKTYRVQYRRDKAIA